MTLRLNGSTSGYVEIDAPATAGSNTLVLPTGNGSANQILKNGGTAGSLAFGTATEDSSGNFAFNSGYGSAATAYGCRAWVNFNGTGTVAIRASGNVSSITDNGVGNYNINFAAAMPDANYSTVSMSADASAGTVCFIADGSFTPTASSIRIRTAGNSSTTDYDTAYVCIAVFR